MQSGTFSLVGLRRKKRIEGKAHRQLIEPAKAFADEPCTKRLEALQRAVRNSEEVLNNEQ